MRGSVLLLALVFSAIVHMALLVVVARPYQRQTTVRELPSIELVPQNEAPAFNDDPVSPDQPQPQPKSQDKPKPAESLPDFSQLRMDKPVRPDDTQQPQKQAALPTPDQQKPQAQQQQQQSQQQKPAQAAQGAAPSQQQPAASAEPPQSQTQPAQAQPEQPLPEQPKTAPEMAVENPVDQGNRLAALMNLPPVTAGPNGFGSEADSKARLSDDEIAQFRAHLRSCWKLPAGVPANAQVKVLIRLALRPNGTLAEQPSLIEAAASEMGLPIYKNGVAALRQCAPYTMLPPEKYKEWRVLDVNFSPDQMGG